jgi:hypothetical protein
MIMAREEKRDYPYLRAWGQSLGSTYSYVEARVDEARADGAPERVIYYRRPGDPAWRNASVHECWASPDGERIWVQYDHWQMSEPTRRSMTAYLKEYDVDPAVGADETPEWRWEEHTAVQWRGWVLHRLGEVVGYAQRMTRVYDGAIESTMWIPLNRCGVKIGASRMGAASARKAVEDYVGIPELGVTTRVRRTAASDLFESS